MRLRDELRIAHIASTAWFILCVGYILVLALRQAGVHWWILFSLSGHGVLIIFVLVSLYLFAIFRGISINPKKQLEHPLTCSLYYTAFYVSAPFLGSFAGCLGMLGSHSIKQFTLGIAMGTLGTTFLVWVIVDPITGLLELALPVSRKNRAQRLIQTRDDKERKQQQRLNLLEDVLAKEEANQRHWQEVLKPQAEILAELLTAENTDIKLIERKAIGIGVNAWQTGGLSCMRELRDMALALSEKKNNSKANVDYISFWWDGIGNWRATPIG
jgi:hypothetical protein